MANIYLHELDRYVEQFKAGFIRGNSSTHKHNREWSKRGYDIQRFKKEANPTWEILDESEKKRRASILRQLKEKQRDIPSRMYRDESYKNVQYVRYADDFLIGIIGSKDDVKTFKANLAMFLEEELHLNLSIEKTKITYATEKVKFLGYNVAITKSKEVIKQTNGTKRRGYNGVVKLYVPHEKWKSKLLEYHAICIKKNKVSQKEYWKAIHRPKLINQKDIEILCKYNAEVRGLYNYYSKACNVCVLQKFSSLMHYSMLKTFANKYRTTANKIKKQYFKHSLFTVEYPTKSGIKESTFFHRPFVRLDKPKFMQADVLPAYKRYDKPNRLAGKLRTKTCELCGTCTGDIQIHQVKRLKDLKGKIEWEILMLKNRRKTLVVCPACHDKIHT